MASRRGQFGRSPRPAQSLTNTIIAIAREMQNQRDQNLMDAWQKGGMFEGKKATDELVLAHWKDRMKGVSKDDPLYDTYQNAFMETDYSIHESKVRTLYAQGKMNESQTASFYLNWAKKVPKNSEFYRVLQRDAAQFTQAAKAKSTAGARAAAEKAYQDNQKNIYDTKIKGADYILDVFKNLAQRGLRGAGGDPLIDPMNGELYQFQPDDVNAMLSLINDPQSQRVNGVNVGPDGKQVVTKTQDRVLYHDDMGQPVTAQGVIAALQKIDPKFTGGTLSLDTIQGFISNKKEGLTASIAAAEKSGHLTDASNGRKALAVVAEVGREVAAWPVEQVYLDSREQMLKVLNNPSASEYDKQQAILTHRENCAKYAQDPSIQTNDVFVNKMKAESVGTEGVASAAEDFTGLNQGAKTTDISNTNVALARAEDSIKAVESGNMVWATGEWKNNVFTPSPGGSAVGAATQQDIENHSGGIPSHTLTTFDQSGKIVPVVVLGQNITAHSYDPVTGAELPAAPGTNPVVGQVYVAPDGSQTIAYSDGKGGTLYTPISTSPFGAGAHLTEDSKGFSLVIDAPKPGASLDGTGFSTAPGPKGSTIVIYNPMTAALATDKPHALTMAGGGDPHTDFRSINVAYWSQDEAHTQVLHSLQGNPAFKSLVDQDIRFATGQTIVADDKGNPMWTGGDQNSYNQAVSQNTGVMSANVATWDHGQSLWNRDTPATALPPGPDPNASMGMSGTDLAHNAIMNSLSGTSPSLGLATDQLAGTGFEALGNATSPGTLNPTQGLGRVAGGSYDIKTSGLSIKTPTVNPITGFTTPSAITPNANQYGGATITPQGQGTTPGTPGYNNDHGK